MTDTLDDKSLRAAQKAAMESKGCGVMYEGLRHFCDHPYVPGRQETCACKVAAEAAVRAYLASRHQEPVNEPGENVDRVDYDKWQFLNDTIDRCRRDAAEATAKLEAAEAERDALRKALEPFAEAAEDLEDDHRDNSPIWEAPAAMGIDARHLRAARKALEASK